MYINSAPESGRIIDAPDIYDCVALGQLRRVPGAHDDGVRPLRQDLEHRARQGLVAVDLSLFYIRTYAGNTEKK